MYNEVGNAASLKQHYGTYYQSFLKDIIPGTKEFSQTIEGPPGTEFPTFYNYLETLGRDIYRAIEGTSVESYFTAITNHRNAMVYLLERFLNERIEAEFLPHKDGILESWHTFRFSGCKGVVIKFKGDHEVNPITVIPHYGILEPTAGDVVMDCDEVLLMEGLGWDKQQEFMIKKRSFPGTKAFSLDTVPVPLKEVNSVFGIRDWKLVGCNL
jgi:hypothetical protein